MDQINCNIKNKLLADFQEVLTTDEATEKYKFIGFNSPLAFVERKSDGVKGSLRFTHMPRYYFDFKKY